MWGIRVYFNFESIKLIINFIQIYLQWFEKLLVVEQHFTEDQVSQSGISHKDQGQNDAEVADIFLGVCHGSGKMIQSFVQWNIFENLKTRKFKDIW